MGDNQPRHDRQDVDGRRGRKRARYQRRSLGSGSLWGFAIVMAATVAVNTAMVHYLYGRLQATTHDFRRRSAEDAGSGPEGGYLEVGQVA